MDSPFRSPVKISLTGDSPLGHRRSGPVSRVATAGEALAATSLAGCQMSFGALGPHDRPRAPPPTRFCDFVKKSVDSHFIRRML